MDRYVNLNIDKFWNNRPQMNNPKDIPEYTAGWDDCTHAFSKALRETLDKQSDVVLVRRDDIVKDLWNQRIKLVELYFKYRNKADERNLSKEDSMYYQGKAESVWECIHELDKIYSLYKRGN